MTDPTAPLPDGHHDAAKRITDILEVWGVGDVIRDRMPELVASLRAALAATEPDGLDVERLARAMVAMERRRIEAVSPNLLAHIPGPDMDHWQEHAANIAAEYARLAPATGEGAE